MKTKTMLLSAILSIIGNAALFAQTVDPINWVTVLDEDFKDNPLSRFKMLPAPPAASTSSGCSLKYDEAAGAFSVDGYISLVRPLKAGAHVALDLDVLFGSVGTNDTGAAGSRFDFVLFDRSMGGIEIRRPIAADQATTISFWHQGESEKTPRLLREIRLPGAPQDDLWRLEYRHGLLTLRQGTNLLGGADMGKLGIQVAGVTWTQMGGQLSCRRMVLRGEPLRETTPEQQAALQTAARLNGEARALLKQKKVEESLAKMEESSALYVKIHGENHHDSGNSFGNLATILEACGRREEAGKLWLKSLAVHEKTLGANHPHATLTRFNLGKCLMESGQKERAKEIWTRCRDDWQSVLGPDYFLVKSLNQLLPKL